MFLHMWGHIMTCNRLLVELDGFLSSNVNAFWTSQIANTLSTPDARRNAILAYNWVRTFLSSRYAL